MAQAKAAILPDHGAELAARPRRRELHVRAPGQEQRWWWRRSVLLILAAGLMVFAAATMALRAEDYAVGVIRLAAALTMLGGSILLLLFADGWRERPRVELDPRRREIRAYECERGGRVFLTRRFGFDELAEISLRDKTFIAVTEGSGLKITAPLRSRRQARRIRRALSTG